MYKPELLAPAGDLEKLKTAILYGADAVYLGGESFGLRKASKNFTLDQIKEAVDFVKERKKKIYVTMNIIPHEKDMEGVGDYAKDLQDLGVDALIVSDPGMFTSIREKAKEIEIHMSTQASITNSSTIKFWRDLGVTRVVLAREVSLKEIQEIHKALGDSIELEAFVHGAMCMSYSGRCLLSNYMTGRDANMGDCAQPCRYKYHLVEETRPGEYFPIEEDDQGSFIMNSKDLCMIDHMDDVLRAGIKSLKIEGRVKSSYYLATIVRAYRNVIDAFLEDPDHFQFDPYWLEEVKKVSHRDFTTGFYYEEAKKDAQVYTDNSYIRGYDFVGLILDYDPVSQLATVEQRNRLFPEDRVEIFGPYGHDFQQVVGKMLDEEDQVIEVANRAQMIFKMKVSQPVEKGYYIRRRVEANE